MICTAMQPAMKYDVPVRVKNSYNPAAVGTIIRNNKESNRLVTAITFKRDVKLLDVQSTQMLGAYGFLARVFAEFEKHKLSVDVLASSEVSISLTLDKKQKHSEIEGLIADLASCADVTVKANKSILTLIADVERSSEVLATVFRVFADVGIKVRTIRCNLSVRAGPCYCVFLTFDGRSQVKMMSQGASKVNISFILNNEDLDRAIIELHKCFFEESCSVPMALSKKKEADILTHAP